MFAEANTGIVGLLWQKDCWGTAKGHDAFKLLPQQLYCQQLFSWNSNTQYFSQQTIFFMRNNLDFKTTLKSTNHALTEITEKIKQCCDSGKFVCGVLLDF